MSAVYEKVADSVVLIETDLGTGSGFFFFSRRHIATALHVVDNADDVVVRLSDGRRSVARVVAYTRDYDLAILELETEAEGARLLPAHTGAIAIGDTVAVVGHPFSGLERKLPQLRGLLYWSVTTGVVGGVAGSWLQTDAAINSGNSGGPVVTAQGEVLGVVDAKIEGGEGIGLAVRVNRLHDLTLRIGKDAPPRKTWTFDGVELGLVVHAGKDTVEGFSVGAGARFRKHCPLRLRLGYLSGNVDPDASTTLMSHLQRVAAEATFGYAFSLGSDVELSPNAGAALFYDRRTDASLRIEAKCPEAPCVVEGEVLREKRRELRFLPMAGVSLDVSLVRIGYAFQLDFATIADSQHRLFGAVAF